MNGRDPGGVRLSAATARVLRALEDHIAVADQTIDHQTGFFELGATSLTIVKMVGDLRVHYPQIRVVDLFINATVASLAAFIASDPEAHQQAVHGG